MSIPSNLFFDKNLPAEYWGNYLPHRSQKDKIQFITFHLGDSLPQTLLAEIKEKKSRFLSKYPKPWTVDVQIAYSKEISNVEERYLDAGMGSCLFRNVQIRKILSDAIHFYNGYDYDLYAYVIMPNHVHLLAREYEERGLINSLAKIKKYTSREINRLTGNVGSIWMSDVYDRAIRNEEHYYTCLQYIENNPRFLPHDQYELGGPEFRK